jgi:hypothetical protein
MYHPLPSGYDAVHTLIHAPLGECEREAFVLDPGATKTRDPYLCRLFQRSLLSLLRYLWRAIFLRLFFTTELTTKLYHIFQAGATNPTQSTLSL